MRRSTRLERKVNRLGYWMLLVWFFITSIMAGTLVWFMLVVLGLQLWKEYIASLL